MTNDLDRVLKDAGYLETPASRLLWRGATPTLRNHIRRFLLLALMVVLPASFLIAVLTRLEGVEKLVMFVCYLILGLLVWVAADLAVALTVRLGFRGSRAELVLTPLTPLVAVVLLVLSYLWLGPLIHARQTWLQAAIWPALCLICWLAGACLRLLLVSRLFWRGIKPPAYRRFPIITAIALILTAVVLAGRGKPRIPTDLNPTPGPPLVLLALDVPPEMVDTYVAMFPPWTRRDFPVEERDIANFWTTLATGAPADRHFASLTEWRTSLPIQRLSQGDPTQAFLLHLTKPLGAATPVAGQGRARKYVWEILGGFGLRTYTLGFWHSFPASGRGAVLTERWTPDHNNPPYVSGIRIETSPQPLHLTLPEAQSATLDRENQIWAQLFTRAGEADFDVLTAYLPLADQLTGLDASLQTVLAQVRQDWLQRFLGGLPEHTRFGILLANGKSSAQSGKLQLTLVSNFLFEIAPDLDQPRLLAPTLLHAYGLPRDRTMMPSRAQLPQNPLYEVLDYGEANNEQWMDPAADKRWYEQLKSLGYVQ